MTKKLLSSVAFLSIFLAVPTVYSAEDSADVSQMPTINRLSAETKAFLSDFENADSAAVHSLSTEKPDKAYVSVNINGKTYYFTPSDEENKGKLQTLANIGAAALVKLDNADGAIYSIAEEGKDTVYYGYQAEALPVSGYSLEEITKEEAEKNNGLVITKYAKNEDGSLSEKFYEVKFKDSTNVKWEEISEANKDIKIENSGVIAVENAKGGKKYYRYSYSLTDSEGRTVYTERQENVGDVVNADFIGNYVESYELAVGGAINNSGKISSIVGDFVSNYLQTVRGGFGGAISNSGTIDNIKGNFINNFIEHMEGIATAQGGAINNTGKIGVITGNFIGNYLRVFPSSHTFLGGAIYNGGTISEIIGNFIGNSVNSTCLAFGGAIYNDGTIGNITGDFVGNTVKLEKGESYAEYEPRAGAIYNDGGTIGNITGDFISNSADSMVDKSASRGGAINNYMGTVGDINGNFVKNFAKSTSGSAVGGAIFSRSQSTIGNITGDFVENTVQSISGNALGGAIYNTGETDNVSGDFVNNSAVSTGGAAVAGAVYNGGTVLDITGDFVENTVQSVSNNAFGGAIYNTGETDNVSGDFVNNSAVSTSGPAVGGAIFNGGNIKAIVNSNFINNKVTGNEDSVGGAIYSYADLNIKADAGESQFAGNTVNGKSNAIYMDEANLHLSAVNNGVITFDDGIDGSPYVKDEETGKETGYDINIFGDGTGVVKFNNKVENVKNFTMSADSKVHLGVNAKIQAENMSDLSITKAAGRSASGSPLITVDVEVDKAHSTVNSGQIYISGDIVGNYAVLVNALNPDVLDNLDDAVVPFLFAENDNRDTFSSFNVARVMGSPYMWDGGVNVKNEQTGSTWYLNLTDKLNPDYEEEKPDDGDDKPNTGEDKPTKPEVNKPVYSEVMAGIGLHEAAIEQTRSVTRNVRNKVEEGRKYCVGCGIYSPEWDGKALNNGWVLVQGENATIEKPVDMDADIWGMEAGFDLQKDIHNALGMFLSYRKGEFDLSGKGNNLYSRIGSKIDIDSYLAGLYYRYDKNMDWLFATVYGGMQKAEIKADDGLAKFDTDGTELGASIEAGQTVALSKTLTLSPSLGLYYTQIDFDAAKDNVGKKYKWDNIKHLEAELAAKLEKQFGSAKCYFKPAVIQTVTTDDKVAVTGLDKQNTYHDGTLGRVEVGGRYDVSEGVSLYGWTNYTFGSDYKATAFGIGLNYVW